MKTAHLFCSAALALCSLGAFAHEPQSAGDALSKPEWERLKKAVAKTDMFWVAAMWNKDDPAPILVPVAYRSESECASAAQQLNETARNTAGISREHACKAVLVPKARP